MPGFRGGVFVSCVVYLFRLRLLLPYLSRRSFRASLLPVVLPCFLPHHPFPFVCGACVARVVCVPFWAFTPSLSYVALSCAPLASSLTFLSPGPLRRRCETVLVLLRFARTRSQCHLFSPSPLTLSPSTTSSASLWRRHARAPSLSTYTFSMPALLFLPGYALSLTVVRCTLLCFFIIFPNVCFTRFCVSPLPHYARAPLFSTHSFSMPPVLSLPGYTSFVSPRASVFPAPSFFFKPQGLYGQTRFLAACVRSFARLLVLFVFAIQPRSSSFC